MSSTNHFNTSPPLAKTNYNLTRRELEVLQLIAEGFTYNEIAQTLFISKETVGKHLKNTYKKLKAGNKIEAIIKMKLL